MNNSNEKEILNIDDLISEKILDKIKLIYSNYKTADDLLNNLEECPFVTEFGIDFHDNYIELTQFALFANFMETAIGFVRVETKDFLSKDSNFFSLDPITEYHKKLIEKTKMSEEQRNKVQNQIKKIEKEYRKYQEKFQQDFKDLDELFPTKKSNTEDQVIKSEEELNQYGTDYFLKQIPRKIFSNFILELYAYIDIYTMSLIQFVINIISTENVFNFIKNILKERALSNPKDAIKYILGFLRLESNKKVSKMLEEMQEPREWSIDDEALSFFIDIRHIFAHKNPFLEIDEMMEMQKFHRYKPIIEKEKEKIKLEEQDVVLEPLEKLVFYMKKMMPYLVFIKELGFSCYRYLCIIDNLITEYYDFQKFDFVEQLQNIKEQMKNKEDFQIIQDVLDRFNQYDSD